MLKKIHLTFPNRPLFLYCVCRGMVFFSLNTRRKCSIPLRKVQRTRLKTTKKSSASTSSTTALCSFQVDSSDNILTCYHQKLSTCSSSEGVRNCLLFHFIISVSECDSKKSRTVMLKIYRNTSYFPDYCGNHINDHKIKMGHWKLN